MAKKEIGEKIPIKDIQVDGVYQTYVKDLVKVLEINEATKTIVLYNISGAHKQWTSFDHIYLVERKN